MSTGGWAWPAWIAVTSLWFLAMELPALASKREGDTLSEHVWAWLRVASPKRSTPLTLAGRGALVAFLLWLAGHLSMGWWS